MKKILRRFRYNGLFACFFTAAALLPDYVFEILFPYFEVSFDPFFVLALLLFGFFLSLCGRFVFSVVTAALFVAQYIQVNHLAYFGRPLNPVDIRKIGAEFSDVLSSGAAAWQDVWFVTPLLLSGFGALFCFFFRYRRELGFSVFALFVIAGALSAKPWRAYHKSLKAFLPGDTRYSIHNSLNTFSFFLVKGRELPDGPIVPEGTYKAVKVEKTGEAKPDLIVFVMGESLTPAHMSLFGYDRPTTPRLDSLKGTPGFFHKEALSGAVSTHSALPLFFNLMREPGNLDVLYGERANLFRLAREAGYRTYWISVQDGKNTAHIGVPYIDDVRTYESEVYDFGKYREDHLLEVFKNLDVSQGRHFVVLHFRSPHSPYEGNYAHRGNEFDVYPADASTRERRLVNTYDNAVLYTDDVLYRIFQEFRAKGRKNSLFMMTSDHGQLLGLHGVYGHNILNRETASVPFIMYETVPDPELSEGLGRYPAVSHYAIGKALAAALGYRVVNPNEKEGEIFVHGNNIFTDYQILRGAWNGEGRLEFLPSMTLSDYVVYRKYLEHAE